MKFHRKYFLPAFLATPFLYVTWIYFTPIESPLEQIIESNTLGQETNSERHFPTSRGLALPNGTISRLILGPRLPSAARLGNIMFAYSSLKGLALKFNATLHLEDRQLSVLRKLFELDYSFKIDGNLCFQQGLEERKPSAYDDSILQTLSKEIKSKDFQDRSSCTIYFVGPYLQSWRYFHDFSDKTKFIFKGWISKKVERIKTKVSETIFCPNGTESCSTSEVTWIGVHVRRGDMCLEISRMAGYLPATKEYINKAIKFMEEKFKPPKIIFLLASDDTKWCRSNVKSENPLIYIEDMRNAADRSSDESSERKLLGEIEFSSAMDLAVLSSCNHVVMTVGSFGWWAGYLSGGTVIYFKDYPKPGSNIGRGFSAVDHYLPHWIGMS